MTRNTFQFSFAAFLLLAHLGCNPQEIPIVPIEVVNPASAGVTGSLDDVSVPTQSGFVLMGGSTDVDMAIKWMIDRAKGGDIVVIRASGSTGYNAYMYGLGSVNSVETLLINNRELAQNKAVSDAIRNAEMLFIAGGDQANYINFWKGTAVEEAINYLINVKKVPVGGTSAGCAILGEIVFSAFNDTVTSDEALVNPYNNKMTLLKGDFLNVPFLKNTITDSHYANRDRQGRHFAFLARMVQDWKVNARGIGVDEKTAVCIDQNGIAKVFGSQSAYFLLAQSQAPEICINGQKLTWNRNSQAVKAYQIEGSATGTGTFDLTNWETVSGGTWRYWYANNGQFTMN